MSSQNTTTLFQSDEIIEETRKGAIEGAETGARFGPFGAGFGAGWGAAFGYFNGVSKSMAGADYDMMWSGTRDTED